MTAWLDNTYHASPVWGGGSYKITQQYGPTTLTVEPLRNGQHWHCGIDVGLNLYTKLFAARGGYVRYVGYGLLAIASQAQCDWYVHIDRSQVTYGTLIVPGQLVAYSGNKVPGGGSSTGPHLHFETQNVGAARTGYYDANGRLVMPQGALNNPYTSLDPVSVLSGTFSGGSGTIGDVDMQIDSDQFYRLLQAVYGVQMAADGSVLKDAAGKPKPTDAMKTLLDAIKAIPAANVTVDNTAVLAAIADLKAHPAVASDPTVLALVQKIDGHFSGK